jgi:hypothetical protein
MAQVNMTIPQVINAPADNTSESRHEAAYENGVRWAEREASVSELRDLENFWTATGGDLTCSRWLSEIGLLFGVLRQSWNRRAALEVWEAWNGSIRSDGDTVAAFIEGALASWHKGH